MIRFDGKRLCKKGLLVDTSYIIQLNTLQQNPLRHPCSNRGDSPSKKPWAGTIGPRTTANAPSISCHRPSGLKPACQGSALAQPPHPSRAKHLSHSDSLMFALVVPGSRYLVPLPVYPYPCIAIDTIPSTFQLPACEPRPVFVPCSCLMQVICFTISSLL